MATSQASKQAHAAIRAYREGYTWGAEPTVSFLMKRNAWRHFTCVVVFEAKRKSKPPRGKK